MRPVYLGLRSCKGDAISLPGTCPIGHVLWIFLGLRGGKRRAGSSLTRDRTCAPCIGSVES